MDKIPETILRWIVQSYGDDLHTVDICLRHKSSIVESKSLKQTYDRVLLRANATHAPLLPSPRSPNVSV